MTIYRTTFGAAEVERRYRDLLGRWPVPCEQRTVSTRAGDTFVVASGPTNAPAVVALQGSGANNAMWLQHVEAWSQRLRVYAVDVIGEPGLSAPARPPLSSGMYASWLDDVLAGLGVTETALVGVSLGGWIAIDYATRRPGQVIRLALLAPSGVGRRRLRVLPAAVLLRLFGDRGLRRLLRLALGPAAQGAGSELGRFSLLIFKHFRPRIESIPRFDDDTLRGLTMPVLALIGAQDAMLNSRETAERLTRLVPHATVRLLPHAGHYIPDQTRPIGEFLSGDMLIEPAQSLPSRSA